MKFNPILGKTKKIKNIHKLFFYLNRTQDAREVKKLKDLIEELQVL